MIGDILLEKQFLRYHGEWNYETPEGSMVTLTEGRTPKDIDTRLDVKSDRTSKEEADKLLELTNPEDVPKEWKKTSQLISWNFALMDKKGKIHYNSRIEEYFVLNTTTGVKYTTITWEVIYAGLDKRIRSFSASGMEKTSTRALETMLRVADDDFKRRATVK
ncbi:MAG: hypothetical protein H8D05_00540 [FCB group bacterium]|nr:hypothetical protein [FCB group bacterium]